jgi:hypothetical protein
MNKRIDHANKVLYFATCLFYLSLYDLQDKRRAHAIGFFLNLAVSILSLLLDDRIMEYK